MDTQSGDGDKEKICVEGVTPDQATKPKDQLRGQSVTVVSVQEQHHQNPTVVASVSGSVAKESAKQGSGTQKHDDPSQITSSETLTNIQKAGVESGTNHGRSAALISLTTADEANEDISQRLYKVARILEDKVTKLEDLSEKLLKPLAVLAGRPEVNADTSLHTAGNMDEIPEPPTEKCKQEISEVNARTSLQEIRHKRFPGLLYSLNLCLVVLLVILAYCVAWYSEREKLGTFDLEGFFMQNQETAGQWERLDRRAIHILVTGKTGTGKSALINGLIGRNVTKEGDTLDPTTSKVEQIKQMVHGISMSIFDSPGLQDGTSREQEYLQDMQQKCEKVDLVLYAIKMTDQRVHAADTKAMKKITDAFGHKFWEKAIFMMTFANEVRSPEYPNDEYENKMYFEKRLQDWKNKLPGIIEERSDIPVDIGKHVPIVPAGYYKIRDLPGRKYWFSQFWRAALDRMMESSAEGAGYMLEFSQDRLKHHNDTTEEDFEKPIHEQPILSKIVDE